MMGNTPIRNADPFRTRQNDPTATSPREENWANRQNPIGSESSSVVYFRPQSSRSLSLSGQVETPRWLPAVLLFLEPETVPAAVER